MNLEGNLKLFALRELIEMSVYSSVTGVLRLKGARETGFLFFRDGTAYHCAYGNLTGEAALTAMFELQEADFSFAADITSNENTLWGDIIYVMEQSQELAARWRVVRSTLPTSDIVPYLISDPGVDNLSIDRSDFAMLAGIDGERTLQEIADIMNLDLLDVCEAALRLSQENLVAFRFAKSQPVQTRPSEPPTLSGKKQASNNVIDRILATLPSLSTPSASDTNRTTSQSYIAPRVEDDPILQLLRG